MTMSRRKDKQKMEKTKIYMWTIFDMDTCEFDHVISRSRLEANTKAWEIFQQTVAECGDNLDYASADTLLEFCTDSFQYIAPKYSGCIDFEFKEIEI